MFVINIVTNSREQEIMDYNVTRDIFIFKCSDAMHMVLHPVVTNKRHLCMVGYLSQGITREILSLT